MSDFSENDDELPSETNNFVSDVDEDIFLEVTIDTNNHLVWIRRISVMYCENGDKIYNVCFDDEIVQRIRITPNKWHDEMQIVPIVSDILKQMGKK